MTRARTAYAVSGIVQGVGFRPHVARTARAHGLGGWVANVGGGVRLEIEGEASDVARFADALLAALPPRARVERAEAHPVPPLGETAFRIRGERAGARVVGRPDERAPARVSIAPDGAPCAACLAEIDDPAHRRHRYPFTSCCDCGPRYSILDALPYERANTAMVRFAPCAGCRAEVDSPDDRRFHAQANACPACGPTLALLDRGGNALALGGEALARAVVALRAGVVVAVKGVGGYQLMVDAGDTRAVRALRRAKARAHKPFAVLIGDVASVARHCELSADEATLLGSAAAPIVLLRRRRGPCGAARAERAIARAVAPGTPLLGVMLPSSPLHHLIARDVGRPLVATSGNRSGEPMAIGEGEAIERLGGIATLFLSHDRPVRRTLDDSVVRVVGGRALVLRGGRGLAPLSIDTASGLEPDLAPRDGATADAVLALGGHLKSAVAFARGRDVVVGEHLGDLDSPGARRAFERSLATLASLHGGDAVVLARDTHPDYHPSRVATRLRAPRVRTIVDVPHHLAHTLACLADNGLVGCRRDAPMFDAPILGVAWDGTGHGADGTVWGGEFLLVDGTTTRRVAHLATFPLPGGEQAVVEPRRAALGALFALLGPARFERLLEGEDDADGCGLPRTAALASLSPLRRLTRAERDVLASMLVAGFHSPPCSSAGRLFDAVASLLGCAQRTTFEGQAASLLEHACERSDEDAHGDPHVRCVVVPGVLGTDRAEPAIVDWRPALATLLEERARGLPRAALARAFHRAMSEAIVAVARLAGVRRVALSGGCFQNARLLEGAVTALRDGGFEPLWHRRVPPNDGGLALGQAVHAQRVLAGGTP